VAESLYRQALDIRRSIWGPATRLCNHLGTTWPRSRKAAGRIRRPTGSMGRPSEIRLQCLGKRHPDYATSLGNLGGLHHLQHQLERAEAEYREALTVIQGSLGPITRAAMAPEQPGRVLRSAGRFAEAGGALTGRRSTASRCRGRSLPLLAQRQQIALVASWRRTLDGYLSVTRQANPASRAVYFDEVLAWKGVVSAWQTHSRIANGLPELKPRLAELRRIWPVASEPELRCGG